MFAKIAKLIPGRATSRERRLPRPPRAPEGICVYAVGDIHGELECLEVLMGRIDAHAQQVREEFGLEPVVVFLGDYVDRGRNSRAVLDLLIGLEGGDGGRRRHRFLKGNHEEAMLDFLRRPAEGAPWLRFGGVETLASYGIRTSVGLSDPVRLADLSRRLATALPPSHLAFLEGLETMVLLGDYAFVHAGIRPGVPFERQAPDDLLWIRDAFLASGRDHGKVVVHGHTIVEKVQFLDNRIAVDTGAYATQRLSCVAIHDATRTVIDSTVHDQRQDDATIAI
jgi:serine/threonine protein phosphatase 1